MKSFVKIRANLNEPVVTPDPIENPETQLTAITEGVNTCIKEATIIALFEEYGVFLIKEKNLAVSEALSDIEKIISVVYERGDISISALKHVKEYLNNYRVDTDLRLKERDKAKFFEHVFVEEISELLATSSTEVSGCEEFTELVTLQKKLNIVKTKIVSKYKQYAIKHCNDFMTSYGKLFDQTFVENT